jgi:chromate transporter
MSWLDVVSYPRIIPVTQAEENTSAGERVAYTALSPLERRRRLGELARVFLRLGAIGFGGPAAHIALINQEVVSRRQWMSQEKLLDLIGITHLIPGPNSTELAIHIGYERAGWRGLWLAGSCFILPAMLIVWLLAAVYDRSQTLPQMTGLLSGVKPVMIVIILQAVWSLGQKAAKDLPTIGAMGGAIAGYFLGLDEILLLLGLSLGVMLIKQWRTGGHLQPAWLLPLAISLAEPGNPSPKALSPSGQTVFLFFLKVGTVLYGSGYVLLAFLEKDLVQRHHWLTTQQLLDAIAIGQFTPGPVFTTATFIGYLLAGNIGALAASLGIFLPAFLLVWGVNPWVPKLRQSAWVGSFLDGVNAASLGLMAAVTFTLAGSALVDGLSWSLVILSGIAAWRFKINPAVLVAVGGGIGLVAHL